MERTKNITIQEKFNREVYSEKEVQLLTDLNKKRIFSINRVKNIKILFNIKLWKIRIQVIKIK
jgi:hypothetical protein